MPQCLNVASATIIAITNLHTHDLGFCRLKPSNYHSHEKYLLQVLLKILNHSAGSAFL